MANDGKGHQNGPLKTVTKNNMGGSRITHNRRKIDANKTPGDGINRPLKSNRK